LFLCSQAHISKPRVYLVVIMICLVGRDRWLSRLRDGWLSREGWVAKSEGWVAKSEGWVAARVRIQTFRKNNKWAT
jgi:hypothetical protein